MKPHQLPFWGKSALEYGGASRRGRRKIQRPFDRKRAMHIVIRSKKAVGANSFLHRKHKARIHFILEELVSRYGMKLYRYENVGNHLHLLLKFPSRRELRAFLRVFPQRVMFLVTGAKKGAAKGRFFDAIAYSRVMSFGKEFNALKSYLWKNKLEALGFDRGTILRWRKAAHEVPL